jgi:hypothetical protein
MNRSLHFHKVLHNRCYIRQPRVFVVRHTTARTHPCCTVRVVSVSDIVTCAQVRVGSNPAHSSPTLTVVVSERSKEAGPSPAVREHSWDRNPPTTSTFLPLSFYWTLWQIPFCQTSYKLTPLCFLLPIWCFLLTRHTPHTTSHSKYHSVLLPKRISPHSKVLPS